VEWVGGGDGARAGVAAYRAATPTRPAYPIAGSFAGCLDGALDRGVAPSRPGGSAMPNYYERYQPDI